MINSRPTKIHPTEFICDLCGQQTSKPFFVGTDFMHGLADHCQVVSCDSCGLIALHPQPENLAELYPPQAYHAYQSKLSSADDLRKSVNTSLLKRADWLAQQMTTAKTDLALLDLGCGEGGFLRATLLSEFGNARRIGLDFSQQACAASRMPGKIETVVGSLDKVPLPSNSFDMITMWHALEHVRSPRQVLVEIKRLLKPAGLLLLACPVTDSFEARLFGKYWAGYDVPRHLHAFSRSSLTTMLQRVGFDCQEVKGLIAGWQSIKTSWQFVLGVDSPQAGLAKILAWPVFLIDRLFFRSPSVAVFVARPDEVKLEDQEV